MIFFRTLCLAELFEDPRDIFSYRYCFGSSQSSQRFIKSKLRAIKITRTREQEPRDFVRAIIIRRKL